MKILMIPYTRKLIGTANLKHGNLAENILYEVGFPSLENW